MDSFADLPAVTAPPEPHAADSNPSSFAGNGAHPPYSEMIIAAISALKDKDGSSRQAIAKYIEKEYANLPPTHQNLLSHHLKSMKNQGALMMVKHSYMISPTRSVPFQPQIPMDLHHFSDDYTVTADTFTNTDASAPENSNSTLIPRRKPGRPPKPRHDFGYQVQGSGELPEVQQQQPPPPEIQPYQPQFEHQHHVNLGQAYHMGQDLQSQYGSGQEGNYGGGAEPMFASLGLADDGVAPPPESPVPVSVKRGRGRPPKVKFAGVDTSGGVTGDVPGLESEQQKPGRPEVNPISIVNGGGVKRGRRGRPKRVGGPGPVAVPLSGNGYVSTGRPRGRPKRQPAQYVSVDGAPVSRGRGRGRPPKNSFRNLTYNPPTKVGSGTAVIVTDPHQLVAYQELKSKYEHLQSKAKEVVGVVRPYINPDYEAFGALQELENLVGSEAEKPPSFV